MRRGRTPAGRRRERTVAAVVVVAFALYWVLLWGVGEPPESPQKYLMTAVLMALLATPWAFAARILWRDWWRRHGHRMSTMDGPARLLAGLVATLPADRRDWSAAMTAELAQVTGAAERWRFATGCARPALFPPAASRGRLLGTAAVTLVAAVAAGLLVGRLLPAMQLVTVAFVGLVGALATLMTARARPPAPRPVLAVVGAGCVAGCLAGVGFFLLNHPTAVEHLPTGAAVGLAAVLAGALWSVLSPPRWLIESKAARGAALVAAAALGIGFVVTSRLSIWTLGGTMVWTLFAPVPIFFVAGLVAGRAGRSLRPGVQAAVWTALIGTLLVFALFLPEAMHRFDIDARLLIDGEQYLPIDENAAGLLWNFVLIPAIGLPFGVLGAAAGAALARRAAVTPST